jgi:hypothetical protein
MLGRALAHLRSNTVAYLALFAALGGTSYAAAKINGKNLKNGSVAGKKLKKNTVTGKQLKESTLAKVKRAKAADTATSATKLGGIPATSFQGRSRWALIKGSNGAVLAQSGGITVRHPDPGAFFVDFVGPVTSRPILATIKWPSTGLVTVAPCGGSGSPGGADCDEPGTNDAEHAFVFTSDEVATPLDKDFYVSVQAP